MFDKLKTALVLVVIGGLSGLLIYGVNELTYETIAKNRKEQEELYYKEMFGLSSDTVIIYDEDNPDGELLEIFDFENNTIGFAYKSVDKNQYGDITVLVGIYVDGTIADVVISNTTNTANYVKKITSNYILNFADQNIETYTIDSTTGASHTYESVVEAIDSAKDLFLESEATN